MIYASPLTDVAANMELVRETVEICKVILADTKWHIRLLSKSNLLPKVAEGLEGFCSSDSARARIIYGVSTGTLDDALAAATEHGTPKVSQRIKSLHWLQDHGYRTFGMLCPSLPYWLANTSTEHAYATMAHQMSLQIRVERCEHVWAEVINLRGDSFGKTEKALWDAGFGAMANEIRRIAADKGEWEAYARATFIGHTKFIPPDKLRFLQYVTKDSRPWWEERKYLGAVVL